MKKVVFFALFALAFSGARVFCLDGGGLEKGHPAAAFINHYGVRNYVPGAVPRGDLELILMAGVRAPSAMNRQPWHFTVVEDFALAKEVLSAVEEGNVLIVVSAPGDGKTNGRQILDCGLAVESMYLAAQALGYGSRIYTGPVDTINSRLKTKLGLPSGHSAVALVRAGRREAGVDAVSAASSRKSLTDIVSYR